MGFWRRVLDPDVATASPAPETRAQFSIGDPALAEYFNIAGPTLAGVEVNETSALGLTAVYRAVSIIAGTIAGLPLRALRTGEDGTRTRVTGTLLDSLAGPGRAWTNYEWVELVMAHLLLHGNAYLAHVYNNAGVLVGLDPIPPAAVTIRRIENEEQLANYGGPDGLYRKWFEVSLADGSTLTHTPATMTHIPGLSTDGIRGRSPLDVHRQAIGTGIAGDRAAARLFGSGLLLAGLVSGDDGLDQDDAAEALAQLKAKMAGTSHAGDIAFVNAQLKFTPWSMPPADAQFVESRAFSVVEVARIYGIPKQLLMEDGASTWGSGVAELLRWMARTTLMPWTTRLEQRLSDLLSRPTIAEFDYAGLMQPAPEVEIPLLLSQVDAGVITIDEFRRIRNMGPLPAGAPDPAPTPTGSERAPAAEVNA